MPETPVVQAPAVKTPVVKTPVVKTPPSTQVQSTGVKKAVGPPGALVQETVKTPKNGFGSYNKDDDYKGAEYPDVKCEFSSPNEHLGVPTFLLIEFI